MKTYLFDDREYVSEQSIDSLTKILIDLDYDRNSNLMTPETDGNVAPVNQQVT